MTGFVFILPQRIGHRKRVCAGFTMMELMVVMAIMSILVMSIAPSLMNFMYRIRLRGAVQDIYFTLQQVRMNAIRSGGRWAVDLETSACKVMDCGDNDCTTTADNRIVKIIDLTKYNGVNITNNFSGNRVVFNAIGTSSAGTISARHLQEGGTLSIIVASSGRIRVQ